MHSSSIETIQFKGIDALKLKGPSGAEAVLAMQGAQLLSWKTPDGRERLYLSERAVFDGSLPVRGGVPVCFPQFAANGDLPKHGFVRTRPWSPVAQRTGDEYALVTMMLTDDAETRALWPYPFRLELTVMLEFDRVDLELCVVNTGDVPLSFTGALHSYLRVVQVEDVALEGLRGFNYCDANYCDATRQGSVIRETGTELLIEQETDRVYFDVKRPLLLKAANLTTGIAQQGFPDVVVWNPWVDRCAILADMPADDWRHMLCIEAAVVNAPVSVAPGQEWYGRQTLLAL